MKYIVVEIQLNDNGTVGLISTAFDTENEALAKYHQTLASASVSSLPCHSAVMFNEEGQFLRRDFFRHETIGEPEDDTIVPEEESEDDNH